MTPVRLMPGIYGALRMRLLLMVFLRTEPGLVSYSLGPSLPLALCDFEQVM